MRLRRRSASRNDNTLITSTTHQQRHGEHGEAICQIKVKFMRLRRRSATRNDNTIKIPGIASL